MKKLICCLLVLSMLVPIYGCSENEAGSDGTSGAEKPATEYTVYDKPTFTPGTLESDLLTVQTGNFDRASRTADGRFLENGSGYYYLSDITLYVADFTDLTNWIPVCDDPDCAHGYSSDCSALTKYVYMNDEYRLFYCQRKPI